MNMNKAMRSRANKQSRCTKTVISPGLMDLALMIEGELTAVADHEQLDLHVEGVVAARHVQESLFKVSNKSLCPSWHGPDV